MDLRPYQREAVEAVYAHLRSRDDNPCVVLPCGCGKSVVLAKIAADAVTLWGGRVLILAHVRELLEQNAAKTRALCPGLKVGVYSAGLKSRDTGDSVIAAGIQSVYNRACELGAFDLIVIDEAHTVPEDGEGMYRTFLNDMRVVNPNVRLIGLTATPFRLKGGLICKPGNLLNHVCYEANLRDMISQGYLSPVRARCGKFEADLSKLHVRGGEFVAEDAESAMNRDEVTRAACGEIAELTQDRRTVLIFCTSVDHCRNVAKRMTELTRMECAIVTGDTPADERAETIERLRGNAVPADLFGRLKPPLKFCANVSVMTTGLDVPNVDCIVLLRPTASPGLLLQMIGRGMRLSPGKKDCIVLDYGGNILRHGPIDAIVVKDKTPGSGDAPAKKCPKCLAIVHAACRTCPECGFAFPPPERTNLTERASSAGILSGEVTKDERKVNAVHYFAHSKRDAPAGSPKTLKVEYDTGADCICEWVCPEHTGYAREKFVKWWRERCANGFPVPKTATAAARMGNAGLLAEPTAITVRTVAGERFGRVVKWNLGPKPAPREPGDDSDETGGERGEPDDGVLDEIPF